VIFFIVNVFLDFWTIMFCILFLAIFIVIYFIQRIRRVMIHRYNRKSIDIKIE
jgi:hypothetical protein